MADNISKQIFYKVGQQIAPRYKFVRVNMSNVLSNQVALTATQSTKIEFKLPYNTVFNLAKSRLNMVLPMPASGANGDMVNTYADAPAFLQDITFETGNGLRLTDLQHVGKYTKITTKVNTSLSSFLTRDATEMMYPVNDDASATSTGVAVDVPYLENNYIVSTGNAASTYALNYELSNFKHSILSLDKDLYFAQHDMYVKMTIAPNDKWLWKSLNTGAHNNPTSAGNAGTATNLYLYLAVEQNPLIVDNIVSQFNSGGLKLLTDYVLTTYNTTSAGTNQNVVISFPPSAGHHLKRVYHTVWNSTDNLNTTLDCENLNGSKVESYNTYLDSTKLQDETVECKGSLDNWRINSQFCKDSVILNKSVYQKNWFHLDSFESVDMKKDSDTSLSKIPQENMLDGLPVEKGFLYQVNATTANAAFIHLNFAVFQRSVLITKDGVQFA